MSLLLDTCALLWIANGDAIDDEAQKTIASAAEQEEVYVSPISAWEVGVLTRKGRIALSMSPEQWFDAFLASPGVDLAALQARTLIASSFLPGDPPADPADRILLATARSENLAIVTRDRKILAYADAGHVRALAC